MNRQQSLQQATAKLNHTSQEDERRFIRDEIKQILDDQQAGYADTHPSKHVMLHEQRLQSDAKRRELEARGVILPTRNLRDDTKRQELIDTTMMGYLQMLMVSDSSDYRMRNWDQVRDLSGAEFDLLQKEFVDALPIDLSKMTDAEVVSLFSATTDHIYTKGMNQRRYRNEAIQYIPDLRKNLQNAKPFVFADGAKSYKILTLPNGKILEFMYRNYLNNEKHEDRYITIRVYGSPEESLQAHREESTKMRKTILRLEGLYNSYKDRTPNKETIQVLTEKIYSVYDGKHTHISQERAERAEHYRQYMHTHQYSLMFDAILRDMRKSINQLGAMAARFDEYAQG